MALFGRKTKALGSTGVPATAKVLEVKHGRRFEGVENTRISDIGHQFGLDLNVGTVPYGFVLEIRLADGSPPYRVDDTFRVPARHEGDLAEGVTVPVRVDQADPQRIAIDWLAWVAAGGDPAYKAERAEAARAQSHQVFGDANRNMMAASWVANVKGGAMSRQEFEAALGSAVQAGMLSEADAAAARAEL